MTFPAEMLGLEKGDKAMDRYRLYEELKRKIYAESKSSAEYERRIKALARKLRI